jgi:hypothetical protein
VRASSVLPRRLLVVGCALAALLGSASLAEAQFTASPSSGPMAVSTATLNAPGALSATANCVKNVSVDIALGWSASNFAGGYSIYRDGGTGFSLLVSVGSGTTSYTDASTAHSQSYSYYVVATYNSWTAQSSTASATTLSKVCK